MSPKWPHTGAVLAGGASSRMGTAKGDLVLPTGQTMIEAVIQTLTAVCVDVVTVGDRSVRQRFVADLRSGAGPLGGIEALLASGLDDLYLVCPNDIPLMPSGLARRLTAPSDAMATAFQTADGRIQSLPIRISTRALPTVTAALDGGQNAIHHVLTQLETDRIPITADEAQGLRNINTPGDFDSIT
ncbi:MAG: molybdenum cofactor guanylyltransferase [Acidimicrobiia bacterium]